jgi:hypothetical protein
MATMSDNVKLNSANIAQVKTSYKDQKSKSEALNRNLLMHVYYNCRDEFLDRLDTSTLYEDEVSEFCLELSTKLKQHITDEAYSIPKDLLKSDHSKISPEFTGEFDVIDRRFTRIMRNFESSTIIYSEIDDLIEELRDDLIFHVVENKRNHTNHMYDMYDFIDDEIDLSSKKDIKKLDRWMKARHQSKNNKKIDC